jgi:HEAT repeats
MDSVDDKRFSSKSFRMSVLLVPVTFSTLVGCMDGPFFELKKLNPIIQNQWKEDRKRGDVFSQRVKEFGLVRSQIKKMSDDEQSHLVSVINSVVQKETSSEIRREAVLALSEVIHRPDASATLIQLAQDKEEKVRLAVARSLRNHATPT